MAATIGAFFRPQKSAFHKITSGFSWVAFSYISRGSDLEGANMARLDKEAEDFKSKWKEILDKGDPYYNPNFSLDHNDYSLKMSYNE